MPRVREDVIAELAEELDAAVLHDRKVVPAPAPAAVAISVSIATIAVIVTTHGPVRGVFVSLSFLIVPAVAVTGWLARDDPPVAITVGLGVDVACLVLCAQILVWVDWWSPSVLWIALLVLAQASLVPQLILWRRARVSFRSRS